MLAVRGLRTLPVRTRAFGPWLEKSEKPLIFVELPFFTTHIHHMLLTISYSESANPITTVEPLKPRFWYNIEIRSLLSRKQQQTFIICC